VVEVLVKFWKQYTLYYRDPITRQFKSLKSKNGERYQVRFQVTKDKVYPYHMEKFYMKKDTGSNYDRMFSRKVPTKQWDLEN
jgi:hypothetical protein